MYAVMTVSRAATLGNAPRRMALSVRSRNQRSTRFNHELDVGVKCKCMRRVTSEPPLHRGMLVRRVVVDDQVEVELRGRLTVDAPQELEKLLMPMAGQTLADDLDLEDIEGREQRVRPVAL